MNNNYMVTAQDVVDMLGVSKGHAYKIIRQLNKELEDSGYIVVSGKIPQSILGQEVLRVSKWSDNSVTGGRHIIQIAYVAETKSKFEGSSAGLII